MNLMSIFSKTSVSTLRCTFPKKLGNSVVMHTATHRGRCLWVTPEIIYVMQQHLREDHFWGVNPQPHGLSVFPCDREGCVPRWHHTRLRMERRRDSAGKSWEKIMEKVGQERWGRQEKCDVLLIDYLSIPWAFMLISSFYPIHLLVGNIIFIDFLRRLTLGQIS